MPRYKPLLSLRGFEVWKLGNFKSYSSDLLLDFKTIYKMQFERFAELMPCEFEKEVKNDILSLRKASAGLKYMNASRIYLITGFNCVRLLMYDLEDCLIDNLECLSLVDIRQSNDSYGEDPEHVVTLFVFKGDALAFSYDLTIATAMELIIAFNKENLVNAGAFRRSWYSEPRQEQRIEERRREKSGSE